MLMIVIVAFVAALAGVGGRALTATLYRDRLPDDRPGWIGPACAIAAGLLATGILISADRVGRPTVDSVMRDIEAERPIYAQLRDAEPAAFARIRAVVERHVASGRTGTDGLARELRAIESEVMARRATTASDDSMGEMLVLARDQMQALQTQPEICAGLVTGRAGSIGNAMPGELEARETRLYERLLREPAQPGRPVLAQAELAADMQRMLPAMLRETRMEQAAFGAALEGRASSADVCRAGHAFLSQIAQLEPARRAAFYRQLMVTATQAPQPAR